MNDAFKKLDELIIEIDNNKKIKEMINIKRDILLDENLRILLERLREENENPFSSSYIDIKSKIIDNELVKNYRILENELYFTVLEINKRINGLIDRSKC